MIPSKKSLFLALALIIVPRLYAQIPAILQVKEHTLSNGMSVWLNEDHSQPKVMGAVVVNAGSKDCPNTGIAHYFEHIMFKGTNEIGTVDYAQEKPWLDSIAACYDRLASTKDEAERTSIQKHINELSQKAGEYAIPNEFNRLISLYGGSELNAGTSYDLTFYHNIFAPQYMEQWCLLNSDRLLHPVFRLFQGELETVYEEKNRASDNTMNNLRETLMKELFGTNAYAYPIIGSTENLKNPKLSDMEDFYSKYYVGCNMGLVLCGDFQSDSIMPLLERTFGRIPRGVKPVRQPSPIPDITQDRTVEFRIPIPLISMDVLAFKCPTEFEKEANALEIASTILSNDNAGLLDSLVNESVVMACNLAVTSLNDAGFGMLMIVPRLFGKTEKAEKACLDQVQRIINGEFSEEDLAINKRNYYREAIQELETMDDRALKMVMVMSSGHSWQEYIDKINAINNVSKSDVMSAAQRYLSGPFIHFKKKYGKSEKDKVSQPGYTPVVPKHKNAESEYAKRLQTIPVEDWSPRLIDFERDATITPLGGQATLYTVKNPVNDIFELTVTYNRGEKADPRLSATSAFFNFVGTDSLTRQQFNSALQDLGAEMQFSSDYSSFEMTIKGIDENFAPTMRLVNHFLTHAQSSKNALEKVREEARSAEKDLAEDNQSVFLALLRKVVVGNNSPYLTRMTYKEMKKLTGEEMLESFRDVEGSACSIVYSGTLASSEVEGIIRSTIPVELSKSPYVSYGNDGMGYDSPIVYVYDMPSSRQTLFFAYDQIKPLPTQESRVPADLFSEYYGGGMSSVLFQEVREFRSMAYSTQSMLGSRSYKVFPNSPLSLVSVVGTQGDKAMSAISLVDSLLHDMPMLEKNFVTRRQECINELNNDFPSFREMGGHISYLQHNGFSYDSNTGLAALYSNATMDDIRSFYERNIKNNGNHRVWGIVGNKKKLNMKELEKYGKVVIVKDKDLFRLK